MKADESRAAFATAWKKHGVAGAKIEYEYKFHPDRRWRFDVAFIDLKVAVEIDGLGRGQAGGHQTAAGMDRDHEKQNTAIANGWVVFRIRPTPLKNPEKSANFIYLLVETLCRRSETKLKLETITDADI